VCSSDLFRYLEPIVRREISINNRDLYTFKVAVKKEYQQYLIKEKI
jgi:indole-3-glycerol phosphate synthase